MFLVGNSFYSITYLLLHFFRQGQAKILLQDIGYAALSGLAVNADHI